MGKVWRGAAPLCLIACLWPAVALAEDPAFYQDKERGWHWYEDPPVVKEKKPEPKQPAPPAKPEQKADVPAKPPIFGAAWLRENLSILRDDAIDNPDDENKIRAYMYAQRVLLDRAQRFATAASTLAQTDPLLDETSRVPFDTAAAAALHSGMSKDKEEAVKYLAGKGGILFFFDSTCAYCTTQFQALDWLKTNYGFTVRNVSVDGKPIPGMRNDWRKDEGQARALGLTMTPTTIYAVPPDKFYIISQGFHAADTLSDKMIMSAMMDKLLPERLAKSLKSFDNGVLSAEDLRDPALNPDDSKAWVNQLRRKLGAN